MRLILLLITALTFIGCGKDDDKTVTVEYVVAGGNADGVLTVKLPNENTWVDAARGANINHKVTYQRNGTNLIMMRYRTATPIGNSFKMKVTADGSEYNQYYLSEQFSKYTYEIDLPNKI